MKRGGDDFVMMDESKLLKTPPDTNEAKEGTRRTIARLRSEYEQVAAAFRTSELMLKDRSEEVKSLATANKILATEASKREWWLEEFRGTIRRMRKALREKT